MQSFHLRWFHLLSLKSPVNNIVHPGIYSMWYRYINIDFYLININFNKLCRLIY